MYIDVYIVYGEAIDFYIGFVLILYMIMPFGFNEIIHYESRLMGEISRCVQPLTNGRL